MFVWVAVAVAGIVGAIGVAVNVLVGTIAVWVCAIWVCAMLVCVGAVLVLVGTIAVWVWAIWVWAMLVCVGAVFVLVGVATGSPSITVKTMLNAVPAAPPALATL